MTVNLGDGRVWTIRFYHNRARRLTTAYLFNDGDYVAFGTGRAIAHPNDHWCKATGRRVALTKALWVADRPDRTAVWNAYFAVHSDLS